LKKEQSYVNIDLASRRRVGALRLPQQKSGQARPTTHRRFVA
jgi:hypothetical protein